MSIPLRTKSDLEVVIRKWLPFFFAVVFAATVLGAFQGYTFHNAFRMGDWLINYQGGFVRRGLAGEFAYQLSLLSGINPGIFVVLLQVLFYGVFLYYSFRLLKEQGILVPLLLLVFSPFIFTFQLNEMQGGYRKEIIYFALFALNSWSALVHDNKRFARMFYITLLLYPLVILTHEMLALFLPYLLSLYVVRSRPKGWGWIRLGLMLLPSGVAFVAAIHYAGTAQYSLDITHSLVQQGYAVKGGSIGYLGKDLADAIAKVRSEATGVAVLGLVPTLLLALMAFWPVRGNVAALVRERANLLLIGSSLLATVMLCFVAVDWGRFIYIHLVSIFLLSLANSNSPVQLDESEKDRPVISSWWVLAGLIVYFTVWHIGHTTETFSLFGVVNPVNTLFVIAFFLRYRLGTARTTVSR